MIRKDKLSKIITNTATETQDIVDLKIHSLYLENKCTQETMTWWDQSTKLHKNVYSVV